MHIYRNVATHLMETMPDMQVVINGSGLVYAIVLNTIAKYFNAYIFYRTFIIRLGVLYRCLFDTNVYLCQTGSVPCSEHIMCLHI